MRYGFLETYARIPWLLSKPAGMQNTKNGYSQSWPYSSSLGSIAGLCSTYRLGFGPGVHRSVELMGEPTCPGQTPHEHQFVSASPYSAVPLESVLRITADALRRGKYAVLIVQDTELPK